MAALKRVLNRTMLSSCAMASCSKDGSRLFNSAGRSCRKGGISFSISCSALHPVPRKEKHESMVPLETSRL